MDKCIKDNKTDLTRKLKKMRSTNPKDYWKFLNASNTNNKCAVDINDMFQFLKSVNECGNDFDNEVDSDNNDCTANDSSYMSDVNCTISDDEILHAVKKLKNNKAPGYDEVLNEHIIQTLTSLSENCDVER